MDFSHQFEDRAKSRSRVRSVGDEQLVPDIVDEQTHRTVPERFEEEAAGFGLRHLERLNRNGAERASETFDLGCGRNTVRDAIEGVRGARTSSRAPHSSVAIRD